MHFRSDSVVPPYPYFVNFRVASVNTMEKLGSVSATPTRVRRPICSSYWRQQGHDIGEVTVERVSNSKAYSDYIKKMSLKLLNVLSRKIFL